MWNIQKIQKLVKKHKPDNYYAEMPIIPEECKAVDFETSIEKHFNKKYKWYERLEHFWWKIERVGNYIIRIPRNIKWFFQRAIRGWANSDTWSFDWYLSKVISEGLIHLKKHKMGYPAKYTEKEWDEIVETMIQAFTLAKLISNGELEYVPQLPPESYEEKLWNDIDTLARKYDGRCITKEEEKKMKDGFKFFIDNFFSLWD